MSCGVDPNIVGIRAQIDSTHLDQVFPLIDANRAITGVGDVDAVRTWLVPYALGLFEPGNCLENRTVLEVNDAETVVAEFGDVEPLPCDIQGEVVYSAVHVSQWDFVVQLEHHRLCGARGADPKDPKDGSEQ
jgi:hypothetical protein